MISLFGDLLSGMGIFFNIGVVFFTALILSFFIAPYIMLNLRKVQKHGQPIRTDGPQTHLETKKNTLTMGGLIILSATILSSLFYTDLSKPEIWILLFSLISFAMLGGIDDTLKLRKNNYHGVSVKKKLFFQFTLAIMIVFSMKFIYPNDQFSKIHFFYGQLIDLGFLYIPFAICVIVGTSNAVNLTDGLDGLATVPIIISALSLAIIAYFDNQSMDIILFCASLIGASLCFLWFNALPAKIFMGDIGSLSLGASLGTMSVMIKHELVFAIIAGVFLMEAISVILQVASFKLRKGNRLFLMAPIHHHFEKKGWSETKIVIRFWIISIICSLFALSFLPSY